MSLRTTLVISFYILISRTLAQSKDLFIRNKRPLPIDGSWSEWQSWSPCYTNSRDHENFYAPLENYVIQSRNRSCNSPKPIHGGKDCEPPSHRFRQCSCMNPLGMSTKIIGDSQITGSPSLTNYDPHNARLNKSYTGWCSKYRVSHTRQAYLQIDFDKFANVGAIKTLDTIKGRTVFYKAEYSLNGNDWKQIQSSSGSNSFKGNLIRGKEAQTNFSQHKVMKYLRVSPLKSYKYPCLKMEVMGCMFTCGSTLTDSFGKITARSRIDIDQNCLWRIEVLNTTSLTFDFTIFDILCSHGYLDFHDGNKEFTNAPLVKRICLKNRDEDLPMFTLNNNVAWLNFVSNSSDSEDGFNIRYFSECKQNIQLVKGEPVVIKSPNYPKDYFDNLQCTWIINAPKNDFKGTIDLSIKDDFNIESVNKTSCPDDVVEIKFYKGTSETLLGQFCNAKKPEWNYQLDADKINITFKTDPILAKKGFHMTIVSGVIVTPTDVDSTSTSLTELPSKTSHKNESEISAKKEDSVNDSSHWTIIIISAFSAFAFFLLAFVIGSNLRRYINNRNELNAQCAKVAAKNKEKQLKESKHKDEIKKLLHQDPMNNQPNVVISPGNIPVDNQNNIKTCEDIHHDDGVDEEHSLMSPSSSNSMESPVAEVDIPTKYESSVLSVHSPLKSSSTPSTSVIDVSNGCDSESCV